VYTEAGWKRFEEMKANPEATGFVELSSEDEAPAPEEKKLILLTLQGATGRVKLRVSPVLNPPRCSHFRRRL
jgi:hypothetical protein